MQYLDMPGQLPLSSANLYLPRFTIVVSNQYYSSFDLLGDISLAYLFHRAPSCPAEAKIALLPAAEDCAGSGGRVGGGFWTGADARKFGEVLREVSFCPAEKSGELEPRFDLWGTCGFLLIYIHTLRICMDGVALYQ